MYVAPPVAARHELIGKQRADIDRNRQRGERVCCPTVSYGRSIFLAPIFFWKVGALTAGRGQNDAFAETGGILAGTFRRMNHMAARQGGRWMLYMLFLVLIGWIFFFVWIFR